MAQSTDRVEPAEAAAAVADLREAIEWSHGPEAAAIRAARESACWRHDHGHREYVCTCEPPVVGDEGRER